MFLSTSPISVSRRLLGALLAFSLILAACGDGDDTSSPLAEAQTELVVVTTVAPITSIAASVIGDRATIRGIVPEGTNSHTFEPSPSAAEVLSEADVIFINGLQLEEPTKVLALANKPAAAPLIELGDAAISPDEYKFDFSFPEDGGKPNPHLWTDPTLVAVYADLILETMIEVDPDGADEYTANHAEFVDLVERFDVAVETSLSTVPDENRKLVTYHDAYAYFADSYGWTVVGAIQPADFGEPTPAEVVGIIEQVEAEGVPAIFGSEVFPSAVLEQIANETDVTYVDDLRDDDLPGETGDLEHSWLGLMRFNFITLTESLGGDPSALEAFDLVEVDTSTTDFPQ